MTITVEHHNGMGVHARYAIRRDGKLVAMMDRGSSSKRGYSIYSVHYRYRVGGGGKDIVGASETAKNLNYPTAQEVYETICQQVEERRRNFMEREKTHDFAKLARDLAAGSNSAQQSLIDLANEIETYAKDRSDTDARDREARDKRGHETGVWEARRSDEPLYPSTPEEVNAENKANKQLQYSGYPE